MATTDWFDTPGVQFTIDVRLPALVRAALKERTARFLERHKMLYASASLLLHIKRVGPQVGVHAHLFTDLGSYHAFEAGWDVRQVLDDALDTVDAQMRRRQERLTELHA